MVPNVRHRKYLYQRILNPIDRIFISFSPKDQVAKELWSHYICNIKKQNWEELLLLLLENVFLDAPNGPKCQTSERFLSKDIISYR
jgi:hypothetical protein